MNESLYCDVLCFIGRFSTKMDGSGESEEMQDHFLHGLCWWFAYILFTRFAEYSPEIVVDLVANHFACRIDGCVYDIRGDITNMGYNWTPWDEYGDALHRKRIIEQCIMF